MDNSSLQGQPPQHQSASNTNSPSVESCSVCNKPLSGQRALCHKCQKIYHLNCVNVNSDNEPCTCHNCANITLSSSSSKSGRSHRSKTSSVSRGSTIRRKQLELQRLEEERQLAKERDSEFLRQKYQLLQQEEEEERDDRSSIDINSVHEWLKNQPNPPNIPVTIQSGVPPLNEPNYSTGNNNVTFAAPTSNQSQAAAQSAQNNMPINTTTHFQNKIAHPSLHSTSYNNTTTFINTAEIPTTKTTSAFPPNVTLGAPANYAFDPPTTAFPSNVTLGAPANYTFRPSGSSAPNNTITSNLTHQQITSRQTVPKDLPIFTGNPEEWPLFSSTFDWSTEVCGLTDAENLIRLQKALRGDALKSVQHILIHPSCVPAAISTLKLLYGQPEKILHSLKQKIRLLPTVNVNKLDTLTSFAVQVKGLHATIEASNLLDELNNPSLLQELIAKLPSYFQINWGTYKMNLSKQNKKVNLAEFSAWIFDIGVSASSTVMMFYVLTAE
ncbi:uncharacterized protein [Musca autumnalis]|uniref:uncharacterized protein n=1 Tax=Musca autumnalis TaxID=221902 RepID=UPI003CEA016F